MQLQITKISEMMANRIKSIEEGIKWIVLLIFCLKSECSAERRAAVISFWAAAKNRWPNIFYAPIFVGYTLCKMDDSLDELRVLKMCVLHDLPEARTGDMNYVNKKYVNVDEEKAVTELTESLFFGNDIKEVD